MPPSTGFRRAAWLLPVAFAAHELEEWNIGAWTDRVLAAPLGLPAAPIRVGLMTYVVIVTVVAAAAAATRRDRVLAWVLLPACAGLALNGVQHLYWWWRFGWYAPGSVTALVLLLPVSIHLMRRATSERLVGVWYPAVLLALCVPALVDTVRSDATIATQLRTTHDLGAAVMRLVGASPLVPARAEAADGHAVIAEARRRNGFATWHDRKSEVAMRTVDEDGAGRSADATVWERTDPHGEHRTFIEFTGPTNVQGLRMLHVAPRGRPDEYWVWFPSVRRVQHLAGNAAGSRHRDEIFSGTDMSYRDLELVVRVLQWDAEPTDATAEDVPCDGGRCTKVVLVPHGPTEFPLGRYDLWFTAGALLLVRVDLRSADGELVETISCSGYRPVGAFQTPASCVVTNAKTKVRSEITIRDVVYDSGLSDDVFRIAHVGEGN